MKRLTFLAILLTAVFSINAAKAQVRVHVGLNFGSPYYYHPHPVYVAPAPVYYSEPVYPDYYPTYYRTYGRRVYVRHVYYRPHRVMYMHRGWARGRGHWK